MTTLHPNIKCGEITYCLQVGKRVYSLNCLYCPQICLQWDIFIKHMEQTHDKDLNLESDFSMRGNEMELQIDNKSTHSLNKVNESERISFNDPLEEGLLTNTMYFKRFKTEKLDCSPIQMVSNNVNKFQCSKIETESNEAITDQDCNYNYQHLDDDISLPSSTSCNNDDNQVDNNRSTCDKTKLTELIIKYYKDNPILWQKNRNAHKNFKKYQEVYQKITISINKEVNLNFNTIQIRDKINKLRSKFRKEHEIFKEFYEKVNKNCDDEMKCGTESSSSNEHQTISWLYEKMNFLKDHINESGKRCKRGTNALTNDKTHLPLVKYSLEENQQLVKLYKSYPCLWNVDHIGFRFKHQRQESLLELLQAVNKQINLKLSAEGLQKKLYYIRNALTQEKQRQIECEKYRKDFIPRCKIYNDILFLKDSVGPFKCEFCEQVFNGPDQYRVHKSSHDGSMPYSCPQCKKGFMNVGNCTVHLRRHTKDFKFECQECGKKFPTTTDLGVHIRHHTGEKPYFCDICGQSFRTWTNFDSHRRRHEKNPNHICSICSKGFYEKNKLKDHIKSHLNVRDKICNECGKSFTCTKYLNQHRLTHAEKKKYSCKMCAKNFAQYASLSNHIKSHDAILNE